MSVFVTDGNSRKSLAVTRSLGKREIDVVVGEEGRRSISSLSKYCRRQVSYPSPVTSPEEFQREIVGLVKESGCRVLLPMTDITKSLIYPLRDELERFVKVPIPTEETFDKASDKERLFRLARELGVPAPATYSVENEAELEGVAERLTYPVVIKPRYSKVLSHNRWRSVLVEYAESPEELKERFSAIHRVISHPLIQEKIEGPGYGVSLLMEEGEVKARFVHKRLREKPPSGGVSVLRESMPPDPRMIGYAEKILTALKWSGTAMVEFKVDIKDNLPKLIEVNGRFWGSLQLAIDSGVDFPYLLYRSSLGEALPPSNGYRVGVKSRWFLGDVDHLLTLLLKRRRTLHLPASYPGRLRSLTSFLNFFDRASRPEVFRWDDPKPGLWEIKDYLEEVRKKMDYVLNSRRRT